MANVHASIKEIRKSAKRRVRNQAVLSELKTLWAKLTKLPSSDAAQAGIVARTLVSKWDRAASAKVVPRERANRKKTRIAHFLAKFQGTPSKK